MKEKNKIKWTQEFEVIILSVFLFWLKPFLVLFEKLSWVKENSNPKETERLKHVVKITYFLLVVSLVNTTVEEKYLNFYFWFVFHSISSFITLRIGEFWSTRVRANVIENKSVWFLFNVETSYPTLPSNPLSYFLALTLFWISEKHIFCMFLFNKKNKKQILMLCLIYL